MTDTLRAKSHNAEGYAKLLRLAGSRIVSHKNQKRIPDDYAALIKRLYETST